MSEAATKAADDVRMMCEWLRINRPGIKRFKVWRGSLDAMTKSRDPIEELTVTEDGVARF